MPVVGNLWQVESLTEVHEIEDIFLEAAATKPNTCLHTCRQRTREIKSTYFRSLDEVVLDSDVSSRKIVLMIRNRRYSCSHAIATP